MHYLINNCLIKSENAALSSKQKNSQIVCFINELHYCKNILDYGCGKCRYSKLLYDKTQKLTLVDSEIQLSRTQIIDNKRTTVYDYANNTLKGTEVYSIENINMIMDTFNFILCSNVLSAIPNYDDRMTLLRNIFNLLDSEGRTLVSVQYRNSYFKTYETNPNAIKHYDGWIIKNGHSYSFYGLIKPENLIQMCTNAGLVVDKKIIKDGFVYLIMKKEQLEKH